MSFPADETDPLDETLEHGRTAEVPTVEDPRSPPPGWLRVAFQAAPYAIELTGPDGVLLYVNRAFEQLTGWTAAEAQGRTMRELVRSEVHPERFWERLWVHIHRGLPWTGDIVSRHRRGNPLVQQVSISPILGPEREIEGFVVTRVDVTERKRVERRLRHLALHDALTGLPSRSLFADRVRHAIAAAARDRSHTGVLYLDADRFKRVNDERGHAAGDRLLFAVARRLEKAVRPGDTVARLGGDEFAVLLPSLRSAAPAEAVAERLLSAMALPFRLDEDEVTLGASIGLAVGGPDGTTVEQLVGRADAAMYQAKEEGGSRWVLADSGARPRGRLKEEAALRRLLHEGALEVHYQPVFGVYDGRLRGFEALVRSADETGPEPARLVGLAEEMGLIEQLGTLTSDAALRFAASLPVGGPGLVVSINVSPVELKGEQFAERFLGRVRALGVDPGRVEVELTETQVQLGAFIEHALRALRAAGVRVALDDFGAGRTTLLELASQPIDTLKLDRSFVRGCTRVNSPEAAVVGALARLGAELGLDVVAEGVESEEQLAVLGAVGCPLAQGFVFHPALPERDAWELAAKAARQAR